MKVRPIWLAVLLVSLISLVSYAQAPVPFVNQPLVPDATAPGGAGFTLTVNGTGFVPSSVVDWNGSARPTTFVNNSQLTAAIPAADIATAGTAWVTVINPAPGGGASNMAFFTVTPNARASVAFGPASVVTVGPFFSYPLWNAYSVAVGDFNGDGKLDLAVANFYDNDTVSILLGDGTGNFTLASSPTTGDNPYSVAVGDFNGDGKLDLAVANFYSNTVSVLLGDGTGNFTLASSPATGEVPVSVAVGDFNGDGKLDLAVAIEGGNNTVSILLGDGTGNFTPASSPVTGVDHPRSVVVGDFNGDGKLDLATANHASNTVSILLGDGRGNFTLAASPALGDVPGSAAAPLSVAVGDFNGDGKLDVVTSSQVLSPGGTMSLVSILLQVPLVGLVPATLSFGSQQVGATSAPLAATLTNTTSSSVTIADVGITGANNDDYSQTNTCSGSLAAGKSCFISVTFTPTATGTRSATLTVMDSDPSSPHTTSLTGVGLSAWPVVTLSSSSLTFPWQQINTSSSPQSVTLSNTGGETLTINGISVTGTFSQTNTCGSSLAPPSGQAAGGSCTIKVVFQPTSEGTVTGSVTITDNAPGSPQMINLTGQGLGKPALSASIAGKSKFGTTVTATLQLIDRGTGAAGQVSINQIALRTLSGTGTVTLSSPALPLSVGSLAIGASSNVTLTLNVPATVTKFSLTEKGTLQNMAGSTFSFALAETVYP
jgi:FG-GAP-like repeat/Abnormal spindle-like microcephaly-assoc'd, ASPM-SPD-2-Hydin/FG-GAP repeat